MFEYDAELVATLRALRPDPRARLRAPSSTPAPPPASRGAAARRSALARAARAPAGDAAATLPAPGRRRGRGGDRRRDRGRSRSPATSSRTPIDGELGERATQRSILGFQPAPPVGTATASRLRLDVGRRAAESASSASGSAREAGSETPSSATHDRDRPRRPTGPYASGAAHRDVERSASIVLGADPEVCATPRPGSSKRSTPPTGSSSTPPIVDGPRARHGAYFELLIPSRKLGDALAAISSVAEVRSRHEATRRHHRADGRAPRERLAGRQRDGRSLLAPARRPPKPTPSGQPPKPSCARRGARPPRSARSSQGLERRANLSRVSVRIETGGEASGTSGGGLGVRRRPRRRRPPAGDRRRGGRDRPARPSLPFALLALLAWARSTPPGFAAPAAAPSSPEAGLRSALGSVAMGEEERVIEGRPRRPTWGRRPCRGPPPRSSSCGAAASTGPRARGAAAEADRRRPSFMPGVWVFPGGSVDPGDGEGEAGHRACAVRELAEEAAIELPPDEELVLFSRWITPGGDLDPLRRLVLPRPGPGPHAAEARRRRDRRGRLVRARGQRSTPPRRVRSSSPSRPSASSDAAPVRDRRRGARRPPRRRASSRSCRRSSASTEDHRVVLPGDPDYPGLRGLLVRERLEAGVPGARRVGVDAVLLHLRPAAGGRAGRRFSAPPSAPPRCARRSRQRNQSWRSLMPKSISPVIVVVQERKPGLNSSRRATGSYSFGTVAMKRRLKSSDSNSTLRDEVLGERLGPLDRLDVEGRDDLGQVGHVGLGEDRRRQHRLAEEAADLLLVGVAAGAPEPLDQLAGEPVGAADAERDRAVLGVDPADRLVGEARCARRSLRTVSAHSWASCLAPIAPILCG